MRPLRFIAEDIADRFPGCLLHFVVTLCKLLFAESFEVLLGREVAATVRTHESERGEDVCILHTPALNDLAERLVIKRQQRLPEACILMSEVGLHVDV